MKKEVVRGFRSHVKIKAVVHPREKQNSLTGLPKVLCVLGAHPCVDWSSPSGQQMFLEQALPSKAGPAPWMHSQVQWPTPVLREPRLGVSVSRRVDVWHALSAGGVQVLQVLQLPEEGPCRPLCAVGTRRSMTWHLPDPGHCWQRTVFGLHLDPFSCVTTGKSGVSAEATEMEVTTPAHGGFLDLELCG